MIQRNVCVRVVSAAAFVALAVTGWDAEAGWRRHHRQASSCCEPVCYEPVCCEPVYDPCCRPVCETACDPCRASTSAPVYVTRIVEPDCGCSSYSVVRETVVVPATVCCGDRIVATELPAETARVVVADTAAAPTAASRSVVARNVSTTPAPAARPITTR